MSVLQIIQMIEQLLQFDPIRERICSYLSFEESIRLLTIIPSYNLTIPIFFCENQRAEQLDGINEALVEAVYRGQNEIITMLLQMGADVNYIDRGTKRPVLFMATSYNHPSTVLLLIKAGANINARVIGGDTPLTLAANLNYTEIVRILIENGADVNLKARGGYGALRWSKLNKNEFTTHLLISVGAT